MENYISIARKGIALWVMTVLLTFTLKACGKDDYPIGTITLTTSAPFVELFIETKEGSENFTIDWGDGRRSNLKTPNADGLSIQNEYSGNILRNIVITGTITRLDCNNAGLTALELDNKKELTVLNCNSNQLKSLDVSQNTKLKYLNCSNNQLTSLDVSRNTALINLNCSNNELTTLDVRSNKALVELNCRRIQLTTLDVSRNILLENLECDNNLLTSLDVSKNKSLSLLSCASNKLTATALNDLFRSLPHYRGLDYSEIGVIYISHRRPGTLENPGIFDCDRSIADKKGWVFMTIR